MKKYLFALTMVLALAAFSLPAHAGEKGGKDAKKSSGFSFEFVRLEPLIVPIIDENGASQSLSIVVAVEVRRSSHADRVRLMKPRLKDAFIQEMYGSLNRHAAYKDGVVQVQYLKDRLYGISKRVLGDNIVNDVLLQVVSQRQI